MVVAAKPRINAPAKSGAGSKRHLAPWHKEVDRRISSFRMIPPQDGGWSLMPTENMLRGLRGELDSFAMEIYGREGVVNYAMRTAHGDVMNGILRAYYPQARLDRRFEDDGGEVDRNDWLHLADDEYALVQTIYLKRESYLPLRIFDDRTIEQSKNDPLAGVVGMLSSCTSAVGSLAGNRVGVRLVLKPASDQWNIPHQKMMQKRRDGDDRAQKTGGSGGSGTSILPAFLGLCGLGVAGFNYLLWSEGNYAGMFLLDGVALGGIVGGIYGIRRFGRRPRAYLDEQLIDDKLKSLAFWSELQLVRVYRDEADEHMARISLEQVSDCLRAFDDPAGNSWDLGPVQSYSGVKVNNFDHKRPHPFLGSGNSLGYLDARRAQRTALSAREVASLWHPPLGTDEMASMERTAAGMLIPFLSDLSVAGEDTGPLVGEAEADEQLKIRLPESAIRKHCLILGKSGVGKSTMIKHIVYHKLLRKAAGKDHGAIVVIDPHADLVRDILKMVPPEIAHKVRLLDFGREDRVPGINLVDPMLFPDRDRCVDTIINTVKNLWEHWGGRLEDLLKRSLSIIHEYNSHPDTPRSEMLTMLDILRLLDDGETSGRGPSAKTEMSAWQKHVLSRTVDPSLEQWFKSYLAWPAETRAEATGPVHSRVGAYAADARASVIMGQRESSIVLSDILTDGLVLLVATAAGTVGKQPAALMGGTMVSLVESALRDQEKIDPSLRAKCLLICDEFQTVTGADWEGLLAEIRKYGCSLMLATQSLERLDTGERKLKAGILGNVGVFVGYQMSAADAKVVSEEMDSSRVAASFLISLNPHHCYVRINSDSTCYPAFSMKTYPPPDATYGSSGSVDAVLEASIAYTIDFKECRARMLAEGKARLSGGKVGAAPEGVDGGSTAAAPAAGGFNPFEFSQNELKDRMEERRRSAGGGAAAADSEISAEGPAAAPAESESGSGVLVAGSGDVDSGVAAGAEFVDPVSAAAEAAAERRVESGALRGVRDSSVESSIFSPELLAQIKSNANTDPGLREVLDHRMGNQIQRARRKAEREVGAEVQSQVRSAVDAERERVRAEEESRALALVSAAVGGASEIPAGQSRDFSRLRQVPQD